MALTGWIYLGLFIMILFIIIKKVTSNSNPNEGMYKNKTIVKLQDGITRDLEINYNNPNKTIEHDENTGFPYVNRKRGFMDRGDQKIYLDNNNFMVFEYPGWTLVLDQISVMNKFISQKLIDNEKIILELQNSVGIKNERILELESKMELLFKEKIKTHKEMKDASMVVLKEKSRR